MSRIGKKQIIIPENVNIKIEDGVVSVSGPLGELSRFFKDDIEIIAKDGVVSLKPKKKTKQIYALWGTYASHIQNMIDGVVKGFEKKLMMEGVGFKAKMEGDKLVLSLGFSHPVNVEINDGLKVGVEKNTIIVFGADKEKVGQFSAEIRALKKPEPYKGKGIRYENEIIRRKTGKKASSA